MTVWLTPKLRTGRSRPGGLTSQSLVANATTYVDDHFVMAEDISTVTLPDSMRRFGAGTACRVTGPPARPFVHVAKPVSLRTPL